MCMYSSSWGGTESDRNNMEGRQLPPPHSTMEFRGIQKPEFKPGLPGYYEDIFIKAGELNLF